jgi:hypothetical protein
MSTWVERITNHAIWGTLSSLGPAIDQGLGRDGIEPTSIDTLERIRTVLAFTGKRLASTDPFLTPPGPLDQINGAMQVAQTEVQQFIADGNIGHLTTASQQADNLLVYLAGVMVPLTPDETGAVKDAAVAYRSTLEDQLNKAAATVAKINEQTDASKTKLSELVTETTTERQRLSAVVSDFQGQFSTAQEKRNQEYADAQTARQERFQAILADYTQKLTDQSAEFSRQKESVLLVCQGDLANLRQTHGNAAQAILDEMQKQKTDVEKLVGVIGNLGVTSGYVKTANYARRATWIWRGITVAALLGLAFFAYQALMSGTTLSWENLAARVLLTLTVGVLAAYSARQADKYMEIERRNRKLALEFEAIGPYLAPLAKEKQDEFRLKIGDLSFGKEDHGFRRSDKSPATVIDLIQSKELVEVLKQVAEITKAAKQV